MDLNGFCEKDKKDEDCSKCRQRKSVTHEKVEEHLRHVSYNAKPDPGNWEKPKLSPDWSQHNSKPMVDQTDFIGNFLGPIGKWQMKVIFLVYLTKIPSSWFMSCVSFRESSNIELSINNFSVCRLFSQRRVGTDKN